MIITGKLQATADRLLFWGSTGRKTVYCKICNFFVYTGNKTHSDIVSKKRMKTKQKLKFRGNQIA